MCALDIEFGGSMGRCIPADCSTNADCEDGFACAMARFDAGCGMEYSMACQTPQDSCVTNDDCVGDVETGGCAPNDETGVWECIDYTCSIGRPFTVAGEIVAASTKGRRDWVSASAGVDAWGSIVAQVEPMSAADRRALRDYWLRNATMEHASVASFARFVMQLMHLGAPPSLLQSATEAMQDEIDHAQRCFALASRYGGESLGPDRLPLGDALGDTSWLAIMEAVIVEACIGETLAALEAGVALEHAQDAEVRETLAVIARDESRHAALGWQTLRWALSGADGKTRAALRARFEAAVARARQDALRGASRTGAESSLEAHGKLSSTRRCRLVVDGLEEVVAPVAASLWQAA